MASLQPKSREMYEFKKQLEELAKYRGRGTELISVYITPGYQVSDVVAKLRDEYGQASNIKSKLTQKNVQAALDRVMHALKGVNKAPEHGLAVFCGNVSEVEGKDDIKLIVVHPPAPINTQFYRCDSTFQLEPLQDLLGHEGAYGLVVIDGSESTIAVLRGKSTKVLREVRNFAPKKQHHGGQCVHEDTLILAQNGQVIKAKDVQIGNSILAHDFETNKSLFGKVEKTWKRTSESALEIKLKSPQKTLLVTPEHKIFTVTENGIEEKFAGELQIGDELLVTNYANVVPTSQFLLGTEIELNQPKISNHGRQLLIQKRFTLNLLQSQVANQIGFSQADISRVELGKQFNLDKLLKLLKHYKLDQEAFIANYSHFEINDQIPAKLTPALSQLLGYFVGDGTIQNDRIILYDTNKTTLQSYSKLIESIFAVKPKLMQREEKGYYELRTYSYTIPKILRQVLPEIAILGKQRDVPQIIQTSSNECIATFISGLFDAEATVSSRRISIAMANKQVIEKLQLLLLRFGITTSYYEKQTKHDQQYAIDINESQSLQNYLTLIGFSCKEKQQKLTTLVKSKANSANYTAQIPISGKLVAKMAKELGMPHKKYFKSSEMFLSGKRKMSKAVFTKQILSAFERKYQELQFIGHPLEEKAQHYLTVIKAAAQADVISASIQEINQVTPNGYFYDFAIQKYQNFNANGIVVHNSAARYQRIHDNETEAYYKRVGEAMDAFLEIKNFQGVIVGGAGPNKETFMKLKPFNYQLKILGVVDTGYSDEQGLRELVEKSEDILKEQSGVLEKQLFDRFMNAIIHDGLAVYGLKDVREAIESRKAGSLLVTEGLDFKEFNVPNYEALNKEVEDIVALAEEQGIPVEFISRDTHEGAQFHATFRGLGAFLRYK